MVDVVAVTACGSHDGGVGNGRTMVSANGTGKAGGNGNDHHLSGREYAQHDGDKNTEGTSACTGCKC